MHRCIKIGMHASIAFLFTLLIAFSDSVQAQIPGDGFIPDPPVAGQPIVFRQTFVGCPPIPAPNVDGESEWLLVDGNDIHLFIVFLTGIPCGVPPQGPTVDFDLGILPAGQYTLFQYIVPSSVTFPANPNEFDPASETVFGVVEAAASIPSLNAWGFGLLVMILAGFAAWRFSTRSAG